MNFTHVMHDVVALCRGIKDIPPQRVGQWLSQQKRLLLDILQRKVYSHRHNSYITSAKNRGIRTGKITCISTSFAALKSDLVLSICLPLSRHMQCYLSTLRTAIQALLLLSTVGLQHQMSIHKFAKEQTDLIAHSLVRVFCYKNMNVR